MGDQQKRSENARHIVILGAGFAGLGYAHDASSHYRSLPSEKSTSTIRRGYFQRFL
jgi:NADH dehydrogenase FAD-containing subunit